MSSGSDARESRFDAITQSESYYKKQNEGPSPSQRHRCCSFVLTRASFSPAALQKENKVLRSKVESLDQEIRLLKRSINASQLKSQPVTQPSKSLGSDGLSSIAADAIHPSDDGDVLSPSHSLREVAEVTSHSSAVYAAKFAPSGKHFASVGMDKTVRLFSFTETSGECSISPSSVLTEHASSVVDLDWGLTSSILVSCSYDGTAKLWDTAEGKLINSFDTGGMSQAVCWADSSVFATCSAKGLLCLHDVRSPTGADAPKHQHRVCLGALCSIGAEGAPVLLAGDVEGGLFLWDVRKPDVLDKLSVDVGEKPISCLSALSTGANDFVVSVNSFDDTLRVCAVTRDGINPRLLSRLNGHKNRSFPIKSSLFKGASYRLPAIGSSKTASGPPPPFHMTSMSHF
jgi:WD40 repeat protein